MGRVPKTSDDRVGPRRQWPARGGSRQPQVPTLRDPHRRGEPQVSQIFNFPGISGAKVEGWSVSLGGKVWPELPPG